MRTETTYISEDGKKFETEKACREYEENIKRERVIAIQKTMCELDELYYVDNNGEKHWFDKEFTEEEAKTFFEGCFEDIVAYMPG